MSISHPIKIKEILLIGAGNIGIYHLAALRRKSDINVTITDICEDRTVFLKDLLELPQKNVVSDTIDINQFDYVILCIPPKTRGAWLDRISKNGNINVISEKPVSRGAQILAVPYLKQLDYNRTYLKREIRNKISFDLNLHRLEYHIAASEVSVKILEDLYSHGLSVLMQILEDADWKVADVRLGDISFNRNKGEVLFNLKKNVQDVVNVVDLKICLDNQAQHDSIGINNKRYSFETPIQSLRKSPIRFLIDRFLFGRRDYIYDYFDEFYTKVFLDDFSELMDKTIEIDRKIYHELSNAIG